MLKRVWTRQSGEWVLTDVRKFVWSGWLMLLELDGLAGNVPLRKYTWGLDLAGLNGAVGQGSALPALEGAGGISGLLAVQAPGAGPGGGNLDAVYTYDANGNVGQLVAWATGYGGAQGDEWSAGRLLAQYEYDPYGGVTAQSGAYAAANPVRFSTKYWDDETGLGYWGYRWYSPELGRFVSRDPHAAALPTAVFMEAGAPFTSALAALCPQEHYGQGLNIYEYLGSNALTRTDALAGRWVPSLFSIAFNAAGFFGYSGRMAQYRQLNYMSTGAFDVLVAGGARLFASAFFAGHLASAPADATVLNHPVAALLGLAIGNYFGAMSAEMIITMHDMGYFGQGLDWANEAVNQLQSWLWP